MIPLLVVSKIAERHSLLPVYKNWLFTKKMAGFNCKTKTTASNDKLNL